MSKKIVLKALEEHLGQFVNGLANLKVAVWQGEITLPGLTLKPEVSPATTSAVLDAPLSGL
jgi:hypothetical protein